jgi:hypothetical protein
MASRAWSDPSTATKILFLCTTPPEKIQVINAPDQGDLPSHAIMILRRWNRVNLWIAGYGKKDVAPGPKMNSVALISLDT